TVPSASIFEPRVTVNVPFDCLSPMTTVPGSIVSVAPLVTYTKPFSRYFLSADQVVFSAISPSTITRSLLLLGFGKGLFVLSFSQDANKSIAAQKDKAICFFMILIVFTFLKCLSFSKFPAKLIRVCNQKVRAVLCLY